MADLSKILVTGALGFYGRHLIPYLMSEGHRVIAMSRGERPPSWGGEFVKVGEIDTVDWDDYLSGVGAVVHLAGLAHVTTSIPASEYDRINAVATARLARAAAKHDVKLVYISSIAAQSGPSSAEVLTEHDRPLPTTSYGRSKLAAENAIKAARARSVIFRPTMTYGTEVTGNMARLIAISLRRMPPPLGGIHNLRSILSVTNMSHAVAFALRNELLVDNVFLLADREPISVAEMVRCLRKGAGFSTGGLPVPAEVIKAALKSLSRLDIWEKMAGNLVVSTEKLARCGFQWDVSATEGLYQLGRAYKR